MPLPLLGMLVDPLFRSGGLRTSPPTLVPIPLSVEMMLARGLSTPVPCEQGGGGGGSCVFSTDFLPPDVASRPRLGRVRESPPLGDMVREFPPLGDVVLGTDGESTLVGKVILEPTLSGLKALRVGVWKPLILSRLSFCSGGKAYCKSQGVR